jgi:ribosomal protein S19
MARSKWKGVTFNQNLSKNFLQLKNVKKKNLYKKTVINKNDIIPTFFINNHIHVYNGCKLQKIFIQNFKIGYKVSIFLATKKFKTTKFFKKNNGSKI